jgi:hypothetical protein
VIQNLRTVSQGGSCRYRADRIESVPNRHSHPAVQLRKNYRDSGKVCKRTLGNLSDRPVVDIEGMRGVLTGGTAIPQDRDE